MTTRFFTRVAGLPRARVALAAVFFTTALAGCQCGNPCDVPLEEQPDECFDAGQPMQPDFCNTPTEGLNDTANCVLPLACGADAGRIAYINPPTDGGIDQDWYSAQFGTLTARSLLRVSAGYVAPLTPVDLTVTVLRENASMSLARKVDDHGQGAPKPIDLLLPYTESNSKLLFLVSDKGGRTPAYYDLRNPYFISVCTQENPDINEPNDSPDAGGTPIPLTAMGMELRGSNTGYIATDNDVDRFQFTVPPNTPGPRNVIYLHITSSMALMPPPPYRLSYTLYDPNGISIAEGVTANAFLQVDLATAKLVRTPGTYTVVLQGYKANPNDPTVVPGDLRQQYTVDVRVLQDLDMEEGNDTMAEAGPKARMLQPGGSFTMSGRISYTPDPEFFAFDVPSSGTAATMHVRLRQSNTAGRFTPLAGPKDRQLRVMAGVPGATPVDSVNSCLNNPVLCPKGYSPQDSAQADLVSRICTGFTDAGSGQCLWLERNQNNDSNRFADLRNMEGTIPVPPHASTMRYWVVTGDDGNNWADDVDWTLTVSMESDPDEARFSGGPVAGSIPGTVSGVLTHGYGRTFEFDLAECAAMPMQRCEGIRSPYDYDAVPSDVDQFAFNLPSATDEGWGLQWEIDKGDGGQPPADLFIELAFCGASLPDGGCALRTGTAYQTGTFSPWYSNDDPDRVIGWSRQDMGSFVRITAVQNQCLCFQGAFTRFTMGLALVDRTSYGPVSYRVSQTSGPFSAVFQGDAGANTPCAPQAQPGDGGVIACGLP